MSHSEIFGLERSSNVEGMNWTIRNSGRLGHSIAECGIAHFSPNCPRWVRNCAWTVVGSRANEDRTRLRSAGCGRWSRPRGRFRTAQFQIANCRLQIAGAARGDRVLRTDTGACRKEEGTMQNEAAVAAEASARWLSAFLALEWGNIRLCSPMFA